MPASYRVKYKTTKHLILKAREGKQKEQLILQPKMANSSGLLVIILCALFVSTTVSSSASGYDWMDLKQGCKGSIAECMGVGSGEEFEMDSESNRRILATSNYISYAALQKNNVPCSKRGASYYNCKQGAEANPYNRGCSAITRCRS